MQSKFIGFRFSVQRLIEIATMMQEDAGDEIKPDGLKAEETEESQVTCLFGMQYLFSSTQDQIRKLYSFLSTIAVYKYEEASRQIGNRMLMRLSYMCQIRE